MPVFLAAGCTSVHFVQGQPAPTVSAGPSAQASPTAEPELTAAVLQPMVDGATIAPGGLASVGGPNKPGTDETGPDIAYLPCGRQSAISEPVAGRYRFWSANLVVSQNVSGYGLPRAPDVVEEARTAAGSCKQFTYLGEPHEILGSVKLATYPGVTASHAWCERYTYQSARYARCHAVLATGHVHSRITVYGGDTLAEATRSLTPIVPLAARALAAATR